MDFVVSAIFLKGGFALFLFSRFPKWHEIAPVYAVISFIIYSWTLLWFFWELPGWLSFMTVSEILTNIAYMFMTNLLESIAVLLGIIVLSVILPGRLFSSAFVARGASLAVLVLGAMMYLAFQFNSRDVYPSLLVRSIPIILLLFVVVVFFIGKINLSRKIIENFADRTIVLLYFLLPLSFIAVVVVIFRNVF